MLEVSHRPFNVLLLGGGAREHSLAKALCRNERVNLFAIAHNYNHGIKQLAVEFETGQDEKAVDWISDWAESRAIDFAVIGLEDPLEVGLPDVLAARGIPTIGPSKKAASLETNKLFLRNLMRENNIPGQIDYHFVEDSSIAEELIYGSDKLFALKPIGLTAGKGVQVMGVQLDSKESALAYVREIIGKKIGGTSGLILEERVYGEEFTLQVFVDGHTLIPMPLVKDFKLAYDGDKGPNTGSMGSYSLSNGLLPFVSESDRQTAIEILKGIVDALLRDGVSYKGIMYGQFCMTSDGPRLIEINARFGDPEGINVLSLLETDFVDICLAIVNGSLSQLPVSFSSMATVCKYITPAGYPTTPRIGESLSLNEKEIARLGVEVYFAKVEKGKDPDELETTSSRAIALVGKAKTVAEAEAMVAKAVQHVRGDFHMRQDIGKGVREGVSAQV